MVALVASVQVLPGTSTGDPAALNREGAALARQQHYLEAEAKYRAALGFCENSEATPACPDLPAILNNLGSLYYATSQYRKAEAPLIRAITLWSDSDPLSMELSIAIHNLAAAYRAEARYSEAAPLYGRALGIREALSGLTDVSLLPVLNNLAMLYHEMEDEPHAQQIAERAVAIVELRRAEETVDGAATFSAMGSILESQGRTVEAKKLLGMAQATRERLLGANHPLVGDTLCELAQVYRREGRLTDAAEDYRRAVSAYHAGSDVRNEALALNHLGQVLAEQGHRKEAEQMFRQALSLSERQLGPDHPDIAAELTSLAELRSAQHKFTQADQLLRRASAIDRQNLPPGHPRHAYDLIHAADVALERKDYADAEVLLRQAASILEMRFCENHPERGKVMAGLAEIRRRQNRFDEATDLYRRAVAILEQSWGMEDPRLLSVLDHYSLVLRIHRDYAEAASVEARAMKIRVTGALRRAN